MPGWSRRACESAELPGAFGGCGHLRPGPRHQCDLVFRLVRPGLAVEPPRGFEPRTYALRVRCSTPELRRPAADMFLSHPMLSARGGRFESA